MERRAGEEPSDAIAATQAAGDQAPRADLATLAAEAPSPPSARRLEPVDRSRYRVEVEVARGGLGRILRARDVRLDRPVAVKEILGGGGGDADRRFEREALITARLEHPAIVPVHDAGRGDDGNPFYAMKLVRGRPLGDVMAATSGLAERLALLPTVLAVADAVAYAHSEGVIHRDLKPGNVLVGDFGETVVIDWGLAKQVGEPEGDGQSRGWSGTDALGDGTVAGAVMGTPAYMAPEQAAGEATDPRTDVYAIGAILYELLTASAPHRGKTLDEVLRRVIAGDIEPLGARVRGVSADLAAIVGKAMARAPDDRYRDAGELAADLRRYVAGQLVGVYSYSARERLWRWVRRHRGAVTVGGIAAATLAVVGTVAVLQVIAERDEARAARGIAEAREREAVAAERTAADRADDLILTRAREVVEDDPTRAVALLATLPESSSRWGAARVVLADALARGVGDVLAPALADSSEIVLDATGNRVAAVIDGQLRVWDRREMTVRVIDLPDRCAGGCSSHQWSLQLSPDGGRVAAAVEGRIIVWEVDTPAAPPRELAGFDIRFSDGDVLVLRELEEGTTGAFRIRPDGSEEPLLTGFGATVLGPSGRVALGTSGGELRVWRDGRIHRTGYTEGGGGFVISADSSWIAWKEDRGRSSGFRVTAIMVWQVGEGSPRQASLVDSYPEALLFSSDGSRLLVLAGTRTHEITLPGLEAYLVSAPDDLGTGPVAKALSPGGAFAVASEHVAVIDERGTKVLVRGQRWNLAVAGTTIAARGADVRVWSRASAGDGYLARPRPRRPVPPPGVRTPEVLVGYRASVARDGGAVAVDWNDQVTLWTRDGVECTRPARCRSPAPPRCPSPPTAGTRWRSASCTR